VLGFREVITICLIHDVELSEKVSHGT
jgi:hypothetical protein